MKRLFGAVVVTVLLSLSLLAQAPSAVPGKEYANAPNKNAAGALAPGQSLLWDGLGNVANGAIYSTGPNNQLDAMAHNADAFFSEVIANLAVLLVTFHSDPVIRYETTLGGRGIWATTAQINSAAGAIDEIDGLEVWGPEGVNDTDRFSELGDPTGCAVIISAPFGCLLSNLTLAAIIGDPNGRHDLDGLMVSGETILFSIRPTGPFDGGEIWVFSLGTAAATFLNHGGHLWDTAFDVNAAFGHGENVIGLEAVRFIIPEPRTIGMMALGLALVAFARYRRRSG